MTPSVRHLMARLGVLELRVMDAVQRFRDVDADPDDGFRGLYVSDDDVDEMLEGPRRRVSAENRAAEDLLAQIETEATAHEEEGEDLRLRRLQEDFGLSGLDIGIIIAALAPDLDPRYERLYGYLHDDVTRRRASAGLALELSSAEPTDAMARSRFSATSPLVAGNLLTVEDRDRPFLSRTLRLPDRVTAFLLGDDGPDALLAGVMRPAVASGIEGADSVTRALADGSTLLSVRGDSGTGAAAVAVDGALDWRPGAVVIDLHGVHSDEIAQLAPVALREARLQSAALVALVDEETHGPIARALDLGWPAVIVGTRSWDPSWTPTVPVVLEPKPPTQERREKWWTDAADAPLDITSLTAFRLGPYEIDRAVLAGRQQAAADGTPLTEEHYTRGARLQNSAGLERLAQRVVPSVGWDDIVLPPPTLLELRRLADRVAYRDLVLEEWALRRGGSRGEGITALFAGESGTGKTMAAEVIAKALELDMYVINLATVVDKYVGETEKNLERIFAEAEGINGILFFDEADALFGKRSEVSDARDRYANVEVAYLLQRMETFDGLAVLATNLKANVDEAFARRLSAVVDFPQPAPDERLVLWDRCLASVPRDDDIDLQFCAEQFELAGGHIRNIAVTAAYLAAANGGVVDMPELIRATEVEYRKLGRLCVESEFGHYFELISTSN